MRILIITGEYPPMPGGISGYTQLLVQALGKHEVECRVLSSRKSNAAVRVDRWSWKIAQQVKREVRQSGIDIVHIQYQAGAFSMHPAINLLPRMLGNLPAVTTFHDLRVPYLVPKAGPVRNLAINRLARWSSAVVVTNPQDGRSLATSGISSVEIPLGSSLPGPDTSSQPDRSVGFFGYPSQQKGFDVLVRAIGTIEEPERPLLRIVGSRPPEAGSHGFYSGDLVERLTRQYGIAVEWTGFLDAQEASNALAGCGVLAFPFPGGATLRSSALIAAAQTGRPVLITAPARLEDTGELTCMANVSLLPPGDVHKLSELIHKHLDAPSVDVRLPDAFQWPDIARRHKHLYESVIARTSR